MAHLVIPTSILGLGYIGLSSVILEVHPGGIPSAESFGSVAVASFGVFPYSIISREAMGYVRLPVFVGSGIPSEEAVGAVRVSCFPVSIPTAQAFGFPLVEGLVVLTGISSSEAIGLINYTLFPPTVSLIGIGSGEVFGSGLNVSIVSHSLEYLPAYNQQQDFFKMISDLVDYVRTRDYLQWQYEDEQALLDQVKEVIPEFHDTEAILSYYKFMMRPIIGTRTIMDYLVRLMQFDEQDVQEWFQYNGFVWHFKVFMGLIAAPIADFGVTYDVTYNLIMDYKNERSFLEELHIYIVLYIDEYLGMIPLCGEDVTIYDIEIMVSNVREVSSILSGESFGSPRLPIFPSGIYEERVGVPALNGMVPFGISGEEFFGVPLIIQV
jgi:hypothetical protein